jgi:hypothetical protein
MAAGLRGETKACRRALRGVGAARLGGEGYGGGAVTANG